MKLTQEQISTVLAKLNEYKSSRKPCSICGNGNWILNDVMFEMKEFTNGKFILGAEMSLMPLVAVSCANCGHTQFLSAIKLGIISPSNTQTQTNSEETKKETDSNNGKEKAE